jgi:hypothetical protein
LPSQRLAFQRLVFLEPAFPRPVLPGLAYLISALPGPAFRGQSLGRPGARWRRAWPQVSISASGAYSWWYPVLTMRRRAAGKRPGPRNAIMQIL